MVCGFLFRFRFGRRRRKPHKARARPRWPLAGAGKAKRAPFLTGRPTINHGAPETGNYGRGRGGGLIAGRGGGADLAGGRGRRERRKAASGAGSRRDRHSATKLSIPISIFTCALSTPNNAIGRRREDCASRCNDTLANKWPAVGIHIHNFASPSAHSKSRPGRSLAASGRPKQTQAGR